MSAVYKCDFCGNVQREMTTIRFNTHKWKEDWSAYPRAVWGVDHIFDCCDKCLDKVLDALGIREKVGE